MIKRSAIHALFAALIACLLVAIVYQGFALRSARYLATTLQSIPDTVANPDEFNVPMRAQKLPDVKLAMASALSSGGNLEEAELYYNDLISAEGNSDIGRAARFNLANAYLSEALAEDDVSNKTRTLLELAKQRYRDLLREVPSHSGARYNLERTLRLAPELSEEVEEDDSDPVKRVRVIVPGFEKQDLP